MTCNINIVDLYRRSRGFVTASWQCATKAAFLLLISKASEFRPGVFWPTDFVVYRLNTILVNQNSNTSVLALKMRQHTDFIFKHGN